MSQVVADFQSRGRSGPLRTLFTFGRSSTLTCLLVIVSTSMAFAQHIIAGASAEEGPVFPSNITAAFESSEPLKGLPCNISTQQPLLGLDLNFHTGYLAAFPVQELEGPDNTLAILLRVTSSSRPHQPIYFEERFSVPAIDGSLRGAAAVPGQFVVGPGSYHVTLLAHDRRERFCSASWELTAALSAKDKDVTPTLSEGEIQPVEGDLFLAESATHKTSEESLKVKVLANFAPRDPASAAIDQTDIAALVSMLRNIQRNPHVASISLIAFNLYEERVVFRQDDGENIDFPALGRSLTTMRPGTVPLDQLLRKNGTAEFLTGLIHDQPEPGVHPDALIFVGPKTSVEGSLGASDWREAGEVGYPVFYLNYVSNPQINPWKDTIGRLVKVLRGYEFNISGPRDLCHATSELVSSALNRRLPSQRSPGIDVSERR